MTKSNTELSAAIGGLTPTSCNAALERTLNLMQQKPARGAIGELSRLVDHAVQATNGLDQAHETQLQDHQKVHGQALERVLQQLDALAIAATPGAGKAADSA